MRFLKKLAIALSVLSIVPALTYAQDSHEKTAIVKAQARAQTRANALAQPQAHQGSSPFDPPAKNDEVFVADTGAGLDTGCTFRSGGPLVITFNIDRVPGAGDILTLKNKGLIAPTARLEMPAYDVDYYAQVSGINPERDRVTINGHVVPSEFLTGLNDTWVMNRFDIPVEWLNFPTDPGENNAVVPTANTIRIDIDTANTDEEWCTAIDWTSVTIQNTRRPVVFVHGILSSGATWAPTWVPMLNSSGILNDNDLNMGSLDSIGNNAAKISAKVDASKKRWGVDAVNLVTHSKGGLDSREYVENSQNVEKLVQLGTPNTGSPLADLVQGIAIATLGLGNAIEVNALAGPAGVQLTRPYMFFYNHTHGYNSDVAYNSLAGYYHPDSGSLESVLQAIVGPGDTIVPETSVYGLGFTIDLPPYQTSGADKTSTHTMLTGSQGVYNEASPVILAAETPTAQAQVQAEANPGQPPFAQAQKLTAQVLASKSLLSSASPAATPAPPSRTWSNTNIIHQAEVQNGTIPIDPTANVTFTLLYSSGDLDLTLTSPSGLIYTSASNAVIYAKSAVIGGQALVFTIAKPETGTWSYHVSGTSVTDPSGTTAYSIGALLDTAGITFSGSFGNASIHSGDSLKLLGTLTTSGSPVTGATVTARLLLPDGTAQNVTLHDDGLNGDATKNDGIYTATTPEALAGNYRVLFRASGSTPAFQRETFNLATVSSSNSSFSGTFTGTGVDTDSDGLFNQLAIDAGVKITKNGNYRVFGELLDSAGNTLDATVELPLTTSDSSVRLLFDGGTLYQRAVDGPYTLSRITLAEVAEPSIMIVDEKLNAFKTDAYKASEFEHSALSVTGSGSAVGVDTNGNGLFDQLVVSFSVNVTNAGFYSWSGRLADKNGGPIALATNSGSLPAGTSTIQLVFDGSTIGAHGVDGPYALNDLLMYGSGPSLSVPHVFNSGAFKASQFEGYTGKTVAIAITPSSTSVIYGQALSVSASITGSPAPSGTLTYMLDSGAASSATLTGSPINIPLGILSAGNHTFSVTYGGDSNYPGATKQLSFTVAKAALKVAAKNATRSAGAVNPAFSYLISGFVNGDAVSVVSGTAALTTTATTASSPGTYPITFSTQNLTAANYSFTYVPGTLTVTSSGITATPAISLASGTYTSAQSVLITDSTPGAVIYFTTDGSKPSASSTKYVGAITVSASETLTAIAIAPGFSSSAVASASYTINTGTGSTQCTYVDYSKGFTSKGVTLNGSAKLNGSLLQLTDGGQYERGSAFFSGRVPATAFTVDFTFQVLNPNADGLTFVIQDNAPTALGGAGGGLGYSGIPASAALKFDLHNNAGEGTSSTGVYLNGAFPATPSVDLLSKGIDLHSGHVFAVHATYDGTTANITIADNTTKKSYTIAAAVKNMGSPTSYVGFTGSTGNQTATANILSWTYSVPGVCSGK